MVGDGVKAVTVRNLKVLMATRALGGRSTDHDAVRSVEV